MIKHDIATRIEVEADLLMAAELVDCYGDEMWPFLERVEQEYAKLRRPPDLERVKKLIADSRREDGLA